MYFLRHPEVTLVGSSPEPMVQLLDGRVISRPIAGTRRRGRTEEHDRRMAAELQRAPEGARRARDARRPRPQRRRPGRDVRHRAGRRADDARALQPRDAPHVAGVGRAAPTGADADRRAAGHVPGRHGQRRAEGAGDGDHRRARAGQARARTPAWSATSTSPATSTPRSPSARWSGATARASVQAGAGIVADSVPDDEDLECRNKARALLTAAAAAAAALAPDVIRRVAEDSR